MLNAVEIEPGYGVMGAGLGYYGSEDDVQLVGDFGFVDVEPGYGVMGLGADTILMEDGVELVGDLGLSEGTKKTLMYVGIGVGVLAAGVGAYMLLR